MNQKLFIGLCVAIVLTGCSSNKVDAMSNTIQANVDGAVKVEELSATREMDETELFNMYYEYIVQAQNSGIYKAAGYGDLDGDMNNELVLVTQTGETTFNVEIACYNNGVEVIDTFTIEAQPYDIANFDLIYNNEGKALLRYESGYQSTSGYATEKSYYTLSDAGLKLYAKEETGQGDFMDSYDNIYIEDVTVSRSEFDMEIAKYSYTFCLYDHIRDVDYTKGARIIRRKAGILSANDKVDFISYIAKGQFDTLQAELNQSQEQLLNQHGTDGFLNYPTGSDTIAGSYEDERWSIEVQGYYPIITVLEGKTGFETYNIITGESIDTIIDELGEDYYVPTEKELEAWKEEAGLRFVDTAVQYQSGNNTFTIGFVDNLSIGVRLKEGGAFTGKSSEKVDIQSSHANSSTKADTQFNTSVPNQEKDKQSNTSVDFREMLGKGEIPEYAFKFGDTIQQAFMEKTPTGSYGDGGSIAYEFGTYSVMASFQDEKIIGMHFGENGKLYGIKIGDTLEDISSILGKDYEEYQVSDTDTVPLDCTHYILYVENENYLYIHLDKNNNSISAQLIAKSVI